MSRLIDADVAEKMLRAYADEVGCHRGEYELANGILKAVCYLENIPTAYDVDKVMEQLEDRSTLSRPVGWSKSYEIVTLADAIGIVEGGGVNGKAILVIDMPESRDMCDFVDTDQPPIYGVGKMYCGCPGVGEDVSDYIKCRPDFCPLRELPEKIPEPKAGYEDVRTTMHREGWNACLDAIANE